MAKAGAPYRPEAPTVAELASGVVLVRGRRHEVLLLHQADEDRWCLPKGHVDPGESLEAAAVRETREETGIADVQLEGELGEVSYRFFDPRKSANVHKSVVYFLARTTETAVRPEAIFDRAEWMSLAESLKRVPFDTDRAMLRAARRRLQRHRVG